MKNIFTKMKIAAILGVFVLATPMVALAATTASLTPPSVNVTPGEKFNIVVSVNPQGTANYAEKLEINYPADTLEVSSFTLGSGWMAMTQPGYDSIDNTNGVLIKTAGYPSGISSSATFGTISFLAKKSGSGTIKIGNSSLAFQANSQSAITGSGTAFVVTASVVPAPTPRPVKTPVVTKPTTPVTTEATTTQSVAEVSPESQTAAAAAGAGGNVWPWIFAGAAILIVLIGGFYMIKFGGEK